MKDLLLLRLEGPLQSWGEDSKWDFRGSSGFPTKSGVVGLLACALGIEREDPEIAMLSDSLTIAVRADRPGLRAEDFQTVTGAPLLNAERKPRSSGNTFISRRVYLQDASFLVVIDAEPALLEMLAAALRSPRWCLYLGRKSCVPSRPVLLALSQDYEDIADALHRCPLAERSVFPIAYEWEQPSEQMASVLRPDARTGTGRSFAMRRVWRGTFKEDNDVSC